jgi:hypothetical protein
MLTEPYTEFKDDALELSVEVEELELKIVPESSSSFME